MMRAFAFALGILAALTTAAVVTGAPTPAFAQAEGYPTYEEVGLTWTRSPSVRDMARFYRTTRHDGRRGLATVLCTPDAEGRLDCEVLHEEPGDRQFGLAGVRVMERARVAAVDGGSPAGRSFAFTLRFGNWPPSSLPDRFQPVSQGLLWVERPSLVGIWNMSGQDRGDRIQATVDCVAQADGSLANCQVVQADNEEFAQAALQSMGLARVERADSEQLAGSPLRWTLAVERQSSCGAASGGSGRSGSFPALSTGTEPGLTDSANFAGYAPPTSSSGYRGGRSAVRGGMPGCQSAMVQVHAEQP